MVGSGRITAILDWDGALSLPTRLALDYPGFLADGEDETEQRRLKDAYDEELTSLGEEALVEYLPATLTCEHNGPTGPAAAIMSGKENVHHWQLASLTWLAYAPAVADVEHLEYLLDHWNGTRPIGAPFLGRSLGVACRGVS
ncbi:hypothetical protein HDU90_008673 [Geranomyces variabilis]|nr:hypothetical protein HDU90_008673 [Geranomyces variabilis]